MRITSYVFTLLLASPIAACTIGDATDRSALSGAHDGGGGPCTLTQGYWKNHPAAWPVSSLKLGSVTYTKDQLIAILETPVKGNGLVQLAHQLIAAKLNVAAGAPDASVKAAIQQADALIGSLVPPPVGDGALETRQTSELNGKLDAFNSGKVGPGHCGDNDHDDEDGDDCDHDDDCDAPCDEPVCGNGIKEGTEACDDGNTAAGDGCSATCAIEVPVCGNGVIDAGETCDDGNTVNGDGCSSVCICEPCH